MWKLFLFSRFRLHFESDKNFFSIWNVLFQLFSASYLIVLFQHSLISLISLNLFFDKSFTLQSPRCIVMYTFQYLIFYNLIFSRYLIILCIFMQNIRIFSIFWTQWQKFVNNTNFECRFVKSSTSPNDSTSLWGKIKSTARNSLQQNNYFRRPLSASH